MFAQVRKRRRCSIGGSASSVCELGASLGSESHSSAAATAIHLQKNQSGCSAHVPNSFDHLLFGCSSTASTAQPALGISSGFAIAGHSSSASANMAGAAAAASISATPQLKRYACRVCGVLLSSASNRSRHERAKHKDVPIVGHKRVLTKSLALIQEPLTAAHHVASVPATATVGSASSGAAPMEFDSDGLSASAEEYECDQEPDTIVSDHDAESGAANLDCEDPDSLLSIGERDSERPSQMLPQPTEEPIPSQPESCSQLEGLRTLLQESDLQASCYPFLVWLNQPAITPCEALVKARRVTSLSQLQPIKSNLRFIFALLYERSVVDKINLQDLASLPICQGLFSAMTDRQSGSARIHAIFLLVKKVLVFLSGQESLKRRQFVQPSSYESFLYVDGICSDSSYRRKQESRNRAVLGMRASQLLHKTLPPQAREAFIVPTTWSAHASASDDVHAAAAKLKSSEVAATPMVAHGQRVAPKTTQEVTPEIPIVSDLAPDCNELNKVELQIVAKGCVAHLQTAAAHAATAEPATTGECTNLKPQVPATDVSSDRMFMAHLVTATLCLGLAPRSQVLKQLRMGSSFVKETDGQYRVKILAEMSKNGKPTTFCIPPMLTSAFDLYLTTIRPRLLNQKADGEPLLHDYVFVKRDGSAPRADFSSCTSLVTQFLIGRPINAHAFRAAVITAFYETGATQSEMDVLATIMAHDPSTAKNFYYRPQLAAATAQTSERVIKMLQLGS